MYKLGKILRELRSQEPLRDAANRVGISHTYLSQLENGIDRRTGKVISPSIEILKRISNAYSYPYNKLLYDAGYLNTTLAEEENTEYSYSKKNVPDPFIDDLLFRISDLTDEEKESLAEHMEFALKQIEKERKRRKKGT